MLLSSPDLKKFIYDKTHHATTTRNIMLCSPLYQGAFIRCQRYSLLPEQILESIAKRRTKGEGTGDDIILLPEVL